MKTFAPFFDLPQGRYGFILGAIQEAAWDAVGGTPSFAGQPLTVAQVAFMAFAVKDWSCTGSISASWVGEGDPPLGESSYTSNFSPSDSGGDLGEGDDATQAGVWVIGGNADPSVCYERICTGNWQYQFEAEDDSGDAANGAVFMTLWGGFPNGSPVSGQPSDAIYLQGGQLFLGANSIVVSGGAGFADGFDNNPIGDTVGGTESGIEFTIAGISQALWVYGDHEWEYSGTLSMDPKTLWTDD